MTRDDVIRMAREAGFQVLLPQDHVDGTGGVYVVEDEIAGMLERFAALVADAARGDYFEGWEEGYKAGVIAERERCALLCEEVARLESEQWALDGACAAHECAQRIRERGDL